MDLTHLHLSLNHFPIVGTALAVALMLWGVFKQNTTTKINAAAILVAMALVSIPVFFTGEPAEETVEHLPGVSEAIIHEHEESAELAIWLMAAAGLAAAAAIVANYRRAASANKLFLLSLVLATITFVAMARVGYYGGQIRHTELQTTGNNLSPTNETPTNQQQGEKEGDDD